MKIFFFLLLLSVSVFSQKPTPKYEFRGAWIATVANIDWPINKDTSTAVQKRNLINQLRLLADAGINAVFFQVRTECDALYKSNYEPWSYWLTGTQGKAPEPFYDPLQVAIEEAHKHGLELHAWFNPYRAVRDTTAYNLSKNHIAVKHPDWLITSEKFKMLNPGLPQVREHIKKVMKDVLTRYDVDGIHFDDYFYPYKPKITHEDSLTFIKYSRGFSDIDNWRRDNINLLMKELYKIIKKEKPYVKFGISPFGIVRNEYAKTDGFNSYDVIYCDPLNWLQNKIVDYINPQLYWEIGHEKADYAKLLPWWSTVTNGRHLYIGLYSSKMCSENYSGDKSQIGNQVRMNRATKNVSGEVYFSAKSITLNWSGLADSMKNNWYKTTALPPVMPWLDSIPPLKPENLHQIPTKSGTLLYWNVPNSATDKGFPNYYLVYKFATNEKINLNNPEHIINKVLNNRTSYYSPVKEDAVYVITSVDRLHNESDGVIIKTKK
jgi:uncharacterized lipoprotein YddW (UPF0748 family)